MVKVVYDMPDLPNGWEFTGKIRRTVEGEYTFDFHSQTIIRTTNQAVTGVVVQPTRWRAHPGDLYHFLRDDYMVIHVGDQFNSEDNSRWRVGNYFQTEEEAVQASEAIQECLAVLRG